MIPELDLDQLDADLYVAWNHILEHNYHSAENLVAKSWRQVRLFRLSMDDSHLPAMTDTGPTSAVVDCNCLACRALRKVFNFLNRRVNCGYNCEWVYPYGWVPEAGCPEHDPC